MQELLTKVPVLKTPEEVEDAIARYKSSDLNDMDLIYLWQAIRDAALNQNDDKADTDNVPGQDSY
ncbi:MAG TPA: hypothetical protein DDW76_30835 [Cyanobacteria bacterium UBA11369]|nr:hypothetical protein [Cyanobacteria bacterium UBA11371]HBE35097.1 hypothetical protein [Cyanobacteria bacterium UBA11368]HBE53042.1 hypothetical protein [Cyanobacteria bacterium UBA11369]